MSQPTEYVIAEALAKSPPSGESWAIVYFSNTKYTTQIGWRSNNVLLMAVFNKDTGRHIRTHMFLPDNAPPVTIGFNDLLKRLVTE